MRQLTIYFFGLFSGAVFGQPLIFHGQTVDTITITGTSGYYHFDEKGTTTGQNDIYIIAFDKTSNNYVVSDYKNISMKSTLKPDTLMQTVKYFNKYKGQAVNKNHLDSLLKALSIKFKNPTFDNIGINQQTFFQLTDEKHIRNLAKIYKVDWHFKRYYSTKEENEQIFKGCQSIDTFNLYLSTHFDTSGYAFVTDVWDEMRIFITTNTKNFSFEGKYPNDFKQPWYDHSDTSNLFATSILNFDINQKLLQILPDNFQGTKRIGLQALTNPYLKWYLQRRDVISKYE